MLHNSVGKKSSVTYTSWPTFVDQRCRPFFVASATKMGNTVAKHGNRGISILWFHRVTCITCCNSSLRFIFCFVLFFMVRYTFCVSRNKVAFAFFLICHPGCASCACCVDTKADEEGRGSNRVAIDTTRNFDMAKSAKFDITLLGKFYKAGIFQ